MRNATCHRSCACALCRDRVTHGVHEPMHFDNAVCDGFDEVRNIEVPENAEGVLRLGDLTPAENGG